MVARIHRRWRRWFRRRHRRRVQDHSPARPDSPFVVPLPLWSWAVDKPSETGAGSSRLEDRGPPPKPLSSWPLPRIARLSYLRRRGLSHCVHQVAWPRLAEPVGAANERRGHQRTSDAWEWRSSLTSIVNRPKTTAPILLAAASNCSVVLSSP